MAEKLQENKIERDESLEGPKKKQKLEDTKTEEPPIANETKVESNMASMIDSFTKSGSSMSTKRLIKDFKQISALDPETVGFDAIPVKDNIYHWRFAN